MSRKKDRKPIIKETSTAIPTNSFKLTKGIALIGIIIITFLVFSPSLRNNLVNWDDFAYIRDNDIIKSLSNTNIHHIFNTKTFVVGNYHPLTVLSYCFEYKFFKASPFIYHLDNILLHLINILLVFWFVRLLKFDWPVAAVAALLFAIHPMRVESVTWAAERKDVLYTAFFFASLICYQLYYHRKQYFWLIPSFIAFGLSLLSKGQASVLPIALLLMDYLYKRKDYLRLSLEKLPFFALAFVMGKVAMSAQHSSLTAERLARFSFLERIEIVNYGIITYIHKLLLPIRLSNFYEYPRAIPKSYIIYPILVIILMILFLKLTLFKSAKSNPQRKETNRILFFGMFFFLGTVSVVLQYLPVGDAIIADRYTYVPYTGLFILMSYLYFLALKTYPKYRKVLIYGGIIYLGFFAVASTIRTTVWKNSGTLWSNVIKNYPNNSVAYNDLGMYHLDEKKNYDLALTDFTNAIAVKDNYYEAYNNRGTVYKELKDIDKAIEDYTRSITIQNNYEQAYYNRALTCIDANKFDITIGDCDKIMLLNPSNHLAYFLKGLALKNLHRYNEAIDNYTKTLSISPNYLDAVNNRGNVYYQMGLDALAANKSNDATKNFKSAINDYSLALTLVPTDGHAFFNRSAVYYQLHNYSFALRDAESAKANNWKVDDQYLMILKAAIAKGSK